jgi:hypothetical protein
MIIYHHRALIDSLGIQLLVDQVLKVFQAQLKEEEAMISVIHTRLWVHSPIILLQQAYLQNGAVHGRDSTVFLFGHSYINILVHLIYSSYINRIEQPS